MGLQVPFAPYLLAFFSRYCNYLFRETQTNKVHKTKQNKTLSDLSDQIYPRVLFDSVSSLSFVI